MSKRSNMIAAALGAVTGLAGLGYYWLFRRPLPQQKGKLRLTGLTAPVEIIRDQWGVPHIYAQSIEDLLFAQGFTHAQERLWQMDFNRRLVAGRLSEILGAVSVPLDRWMRTLCMRRVAEQQLELLDDATRAATTAYAAGVNAFIAQGRWPIEITLLRSTLPYQPEPWSIVDSMGWAKMMAWSLSVNWETEILRAQLIAKLGADQAAELEPSYSAACPRAVPPGVDYTCIGSQALQRAAQARRFTGPPARDGLGSNNWVLAGSRTATGMPLLANDMHLGLSIPSVWYENHLVGGGLNAAGVSFAGIPGIIAGHNQHVAWGYTNGFPDVQDLYMEHLRRTQDGQVQYEYKGEWLNAQVIQEEIRIKGAQPVAEEVVITRHGPIINALAPDFMGEQPLALRWTALEPDNILRAMLGMMRAKNCVEFREALRDWSVPIQNTVYADTQGNIGYSFPGKVPIRAQGTGRVPVPGWTGEYEWTGYIPFEELPHLFNPQPGYIATANNRVVGDDYPHFIGLDHTTGCRARRIVELIEAQEKIDVAYIRRMQLDQVSPAAREIVKALQAAQTTDAELERVLQRMRDWDGALAAASPQAAVYEVLTQRLIARLLSGKLGDLAVRYAGQGPVPVLAESSLFGEHSREWLEKLLSEPASHWFDLGNGQTRNDIVCAALRETVDFLRQTCGPAMEDWAWGKLHQLTFSHSLGSVKPLDKLFNRGPYPLGGDYDTVWATGSSRFDLNNQVTVGPPFRFIADLSDWNKSLGVLVPGQSGHPGSPHYADNVRAWFEGEYHPMLFDRAAVLEKAADTLVLEPGTSALS